METPPLEFDPPMIGSSPAMEQLRATVLKLADASASVLITGESGVGKELVARNLHSCGGRKDGPFVAVNCAALNPGVLESELFGHGRGAFTGAVRSHAGFFEQAEGGTLFLDEIGEIPPFVQAKLLRVLQDREVRRMGDREVRRVEVRVVSATNADLGARVRNGRFRTDLYYRLNVVSVDVPPLRKRGDDIFELIEHFFTGRRLRTPELSDEIRRILSSYRWPGNVRELENELERVLAIHGTVGRIARGMLSDRLAEEPRVEPLNPRLLYEPPLPAAVGYLEENLLRKTLADTNWNKSKSARILGLSRQGLLKKLKRYGITGPPPGKADPKGTGEHRGD